MLKKSKVCLLLALALLLCATSVTSAFATNLNNDNVLIGTEAEPVQAAISKNLRLPTGTNVPGASFIFKVTPIEVDDVPYNATTPNMPPLGDENEFTISYSAADADLKVPVDGMINTMSIIKETGDIFANVDFPHAGIFVYEIEEASDTNFPIDNPLNVHEWLSYSNAKYTLTVHVRYKAGSDTETYVFALGTVITTPGEGQTADEKVDPTPGGYEDSYDHSQMIFINDYVKNNGPFDPEGDLSTLTISKQVSGDLANKDLPFTFTINLLIPSIVPNPPLYYRAYLVEGGIAEDDSIQISTSTATTFTLKHGQSLVFVDTPVGTGYSITEAAAQHYKPSVDVITNGGTPVRISEIIPNTALQTGQQLVGEGVNSAAFTNTRDNITPTGLNLNNLPFLLLIALGLVAIVGYTVVKVRSRNRYYR